MKPFENLTNMNVGLNKLSQFHRYYLPKSREYNNLLISTTFTHLFIRTLQPSVLLSLGAVRYFKAHRSISFTFWTTLEVRRKDSLPSRFYNVTEPNNKGGGKPHGDGLEVVATERKYSHSLFRLQEALILKGWRMAIWHFPETHLPSEFCP